MQALCVRPWAVEMPSAGGRSTPVLLELRRRGIALANLTHAAGCRAPVTPLSTPGCRCRALRLQPRPSTKWIGARRGSRVVASARRSYARSKVRAGSPRNAFAGPGVTDWRADRVRGRRSSTGAGPAARTRKSHFDVWRSRAAPLSKRRQHAEKGGTSATVRGHEPHLAA